MTISLQQNQPKTQPNTAAESAPMGISFKQFIELTLYKPTYAARKIKYHPKSKPARMAHKLGLDVVNQSKIMIAFINGSRTSFDEDVKEVEPQDNHNSNNEAGKAA